MLRILQIQQLRYMTFGKEREAYWYFSRTL